jgi:hypothetical protein
MGFNSVTALFFVALSLAKRRRAFLRWLAFDKSKNVLYNKIETSKGEQQETSTTN